MKNLDQKLIEAAQSNDQTAVEELLAKGLVHLNAVDPLGNTALHRAAHYGHFAIVQQLLNKGATPDIPNKEGYTPLHEAADYGRMDKDSGHTEIADIILGKHVNPNVQDTIHGDTPLHLAAGHGHLAFAELLLKAGANRDIPNKSNLTPVQEAELHGHTQLASFIKDFDTSKYPGDWSRRTISTTPLVQR